MEITKSKLAWRYLFVLCGALVLYTISCAPGLLWQDSGLIQYRIWHNDIEGFYGLALSHPLFYIVGIAVKYVPLGEFAHRVNMLSAVAGAVAVANMYLLIRLWTGKDMPAVIAAITLAVSHTFWRHASIIETYTFWTVLFLAELIVLLQYVKTKRLRYLYWLGFLNGLAIAVHMLAAIPLICYAILIISLLVRKEIRLRNLGIIVFLWLVSALPYEFLIVRTLIQSGDILGTLASAAFGSRWQEAVLNTSMSLKMVEENCYYILFNFPTPNILLFFAGGYTLIKMPISRSIKYIVATLTVLFFVFAFRYTVPDRYAFFIPFYVMVSIFIGLGTHYFINRIKRKALVLLVIFFSILPVGVYAIAPSMARNIGTRNDIPYREDNAYFLRPWKTGYRGPDRFADEALDLVGNNAIIYADVTTVAPLLLLQQVKAKRPDVTIISGTLNSENAPLFNEQTIDTLLENRPIYIVSQKVGYCPSFVLEQYDLVQTGILWKVVAKKI